MKLYLDGIGVCGPGLDNWPMAQLLLAGKAAYTYAPTLIPAPLLLPATERRRTVPTVKLALALCEEALAQAGLDPATTATVFSSSGGDGETVHAILEALALPAREVSPTKFHNSVHNAPSGYWAIAAKSHAPTTSICGYDESFAIGLIDAAAQAMTEGRAVALVAYDLPYPEPLHTLRPIQSAFGVALVLTPYHSDRTLAALTLAIEPGMARLQTATLDPYLQNLQAHNPAARCLPLLAALAAGDDMPVALDYLSGNSLSLSVKNFAHADA